MRSEKGIVFFLSLLLGCLTSMWVTNSIYHCSTWLWGSVQKKQVATMFKSLVSRHHVACAGMREMDWLLEPTEGSKRNFIFLKFFSSSYSLSPSNSTWRIVRKLDFIRIFLLDLERSPNRKNWIRNEKFAQKKNDYLYYLTYCTTRW